MSASNEPLEITIKGDNNNSNLILNSEQSAIGDAKKEQSNIDYLKNYFKEVNYDIEKLKQLIYDAPDFESALRLLLDVSSILKNSTKPLKITHYNTPILASKYIDGVPYFDLKAIYKENLGKVPTQQQNIERQMLTDLISGIYRGSRNLFGVYEESSVFSVLLQNNNASSSVLVFITIDNKGNIIKVDFNDFKQQTFYNGEPLPEGAIAMSKLPEKIRLRLMNHPAGSLPDPLTTSGAIISIFNINENNLNNNVEPPGTLNIFYQLNDVYLLLDPFLTNINDFKNYNDIIVDENIIKTGVGFAGGPDKFVPAETYLNIEDLKLSIDALRGIFEYDSVEW